MRVGARHARQCASAVHHSFHALWRLRIKSLHSAPLTAETARPGSSGGILAPDSHATLKQAETMEQRKVQEASDDAGQTTDEVMPTPTGNVMAERMVPPEPVGDAILPAIRIDADAPADVEVSDDQSKKSRGPVLVPDSRKRRYDNLSPVRCYNYRTQLMVAGRLTTESLEAGNSTVLILDKNAEEALETLETLGFTLRQALLERRLDIYYYRRGVRDRTFFRNDYEAIFSDVLQERFAPVQHVVMIDFNALFGNVVKAAVNNQIEDFCEVARSHDVAVWGLYSPLSWSQDDFLTERLPEFLGSDCVKLARADPETGMVTLSVKKAASGS